MAQAKQRAMRAVMSEEAQSRVSSLYTPPKQTIIIIGVRVGISNHSLCRRGVGQRAQPK